MMTRLSLTLIPFCLASALVLSSCVKDDYDYKGEIEALKAEMANQKAIIDVLQKAVTVTDIQKGKDSFTITFSNGDSYTITNGYTPLITIGENGNWFIDGKDTGLPSRGKDGRDGNSYNIEIASNGYWYINGENTGVKAVGKDGKDGKDAPSITAIVENRTSFTFILSDGSSIEVPKEAFAYVSSERVSATIDTKTFVLLSENYIRPRALMTADLTFDSFKPLEIGRGYNKNGGWKLEITSGEVLVHRYTDSDAVVETFSHGLTISDHLYVSIDAGWDGAVISLYSGGKEFRTESAWSAGGAPFVYNLNGMNLGVDMSFFPYDSGSAVWIVGDENVEGWTSKIHADGASPLVDWVPGATASLMFKSFKNDIIFGCPAFALWAVGAANNADKDAVDSSWLASTEKFIELCNARGITPVLATIPSTSDKDHSLKSSWVKASGCRYVDFAAAAPDAGAMAYRLLVDLPEVTQNK